MLDDAHVNFIDLDDAMLGPAPLGIATFARRLRASLGGSVGEHAAVAHMLEVYDRAWTPRLRLSGRLWAVDVVSQVLECQLASRRVEAKTRQGEIYGCEEIAQARLTQTLRRLDAPQRNKRPI
jgi:hypothetical protein